MPRGGGEGRTSLPPAVPLRRYEPGQPLLVGPAYVDASPGGRVLICGSLHFAGTVLAENA